MRPDAFRLSRQVTKNFYKACSAIDHSFRVSVHSHWHDWIVTAGATKIPKKTPQFSEIRMIVGESKKDDFTFLSGP